jgi:hypothetical protein
MQYDKDLASPNKNLFLAARKLLLKVDGVEEIQKEKITTYSFNGSSLCHMRTMPHGIDIGFLKGAMLEDKLKQLHGETKRMRVLSLSKLIESEFDYYLVQALTLNK